jgi:hypothetical protein
MYRPARDRLPFPKGGMATVGVGRKSVNVSHQSRPHGIEMYITDQFLKVGVFLAHDGFVAVLEEVTVASVDSVETYGVAGQQPRHEGGKGSHTRAQEEMDVIGQDCEGVAGSLCLRKDSPASGDKISPVVIVQKNLLPFDAADDDMVENPRRIQSGLSGHRRTLSWEKTFSRYQYYSDP